MAQDDERVLAQSQLGGSENVTPFLQCLPKRGATCPTCERFTKVYRYTLTSAMVRTLIWMSRNNPGEWVHVPSSGTRSILTSNSVGKMVPWGFVESKTNENTKKKCSGIYRITRNGVDFALGLTVCPSYWVSYNKTVLGWSDVNVNVKEALGNQFDYAGLMAS